MDRTSIGKKLSALLEEVEALPKDASEQIKDLREKIADLEIQLSGDGDAWGSVLLARHEQRPYTLDYVERVFDGFRELHGDRFYADDPAIVGGLATLEDEQVMVIGHQKGRNTKERLLRNYGMPRPEGYRKAMRLMRLAEKFERPIVTFIDTPGAYPGMGAEERGQAEAIASNLRSMARLTVPIVVVVVGEGGSGGALAIGVGDRILMLEFAVYSVISPESCSAILWKDQDHSKEAAENLRLTAPDLFRFGIIDEIVEEPAGGAHTDWDRAAEHVKGRLLWHLAELRRMPLDDLLDARQSKFRKIGEYTEV